MPTSHFNQQFVLGYRYDTESGTEISVTESNLWDLVPMHEKSVFADIATGINRTINSSAGRRGNPIKAAAAARLGYRKGLPEIWIGVWLDRVMHTRNGEFCTNQIAQIANNYKIKILDALFDLTNISKRESPAILDSNSTIKVPPGKIRIVKHSPNTESEYQIEDPQSYEIALALRTNKTRKESLVIRLQVDGDISTTTIPPSTSVSFSHDSNFQDEFTITAMDKTQATLKLTNVHTCRALEAKYEEELKNGLITAFSTGHRISVEYSIVGHYINGELKTDRLNITKILGSKENPVETLF